jgi:hypothetical protein
MMHSGLSALPYSAQAVVDQATNALARAKQALAEKNKIARRAAHRCRVAAETARELQDAMGKVKYGRRA